MSKNIYKKKKAQYKFLRVNKMNLKIRKQYLILLFTK